MPRVRTPFGTVNFPDGTPDPEMVSALDEFAAQQQPAPQQAGGIGNALRSVFMGATEQPVSSSVPYSVRVPGLSPQMGAQLRGTLGQMREDDVSSQLRQRAEREKALEAEKSRAEAIKLEQLRRKNRIADAQMKLDGDLRVIQSEAEAGKIWEANDGSLVRGYQDPETKAWKTEVLRAGTPEPPKLIDVYGPDGRVTRQPDVEGLDRGVPPSMTTGGWEIGPDGLPVQTTVVKQPGVTRGTPPSAVMKGFDEAGKAVLVPRVAGQALGQEKKPPTVQQQQQLMQRFIQYGVPEEMRAAMMDEYSTTGQLSNWDWIAPDNETVIRTVTNSDGSTVVKRVKMGDYVGTPDNPTDLGANMAKAVREGVGAGLIPKIKNGQPNVEAIPKYLAQRGFTEEQVAQFYLTTKEPGAIAAFLGYKPVSLITGDEAGSPSPSPAAPGTSWDDESQIPEGTWYQDEQGRTKYIKNGKPVLWEGK